MPAALTPMAIENISLIHHLTASCSGSVVAAVDVKDSIHLWNVEAFTKIREVDTFVRAPDVRVALSADGALLFAGSWYAGGAMAYAVFEGREVWRRKDLRRFHGLSAEGPRAHLYCYLDRKATLRLDPASGETVERLRWAGEVYCSPLQDLILLVGRNLRFGPESAPDKLRAPRTTFAVLDVAFGIESLAVSESTGPVRCFSLKTGAEIWRHTPSAGNHLINLSYCAPLDVFVGVNWAYKTGGEHNLVHLSRTTGAISQISDLPPARRMAFCRSGLTLVNSEGDVIDAASGRVIRRLDFPREEFDEPEFPSWEERMRSGTKEQQEFARLLGPPDPK
jgi:hypothetical protein